MITISHRTTLPMSITVDKRILAAINIFLTPTGMLSVPKGSHSQLIGELLSDWLVRTSGLDILDILEFAGKNPKATKEELLKALARKGKVA